MNITFENTGDLLRCLSLFSGSSICTIESSTEVKPKVKNSDKERFDDHFSNTVYCRKIQSVNVGINYENAVNKKLVNEGKVGDFKAGPLRWGKWIKPNVLIEHNGTHYLRYYVGFNANSKKTKYEYSYKDGTILGKASVEKLKTFMKSSSKTDYTQVQPRNIKLEHVDKLIIGGNTYIKE